MIFLASRIFHLVRHVFVVRQWQISLSNNSETDSMSKTSFPSSLSRKLKNLLRVFLTEIGLWLCALDNAVNVLGKVVLASTLNQEWCFAFTSTKPVRGTDWLHRITLGRKMPPWISKLRSVMLNMPTSAIVKQLIVKRVEHVAESVFYWIFYASKLLHWHC